MRKALSISLVLAVALAGSAFAKPVDMSGSLDKFQYLDLSNPNAGLKGASQTGVFGAAMQVELTNDGPVTFVFVHEDGRWRISHAHFANEPEPKDEAPPATDR